ncbi:MAG: MotA/TolQ/ExbB proton channel family protein [Pseudomonadota bacterium]
MGDYLQGDVVRMVLDAGPMVKAIMGILLVFSLACWSIAFAKYRQFSAASNESKRFLDLFWNGKTLAAVFHETSKLESSPLARAFRAGYNEMNKLSQLRAAEDGPAPDLAGLDNVQRALGKTGRAELGRLSGALGFLATAGNTAPFIGLFGTVWGIMSSFRGIGLSGTANLATVAPGISEALIATAAGLATAIPAVAFYNYYLNRLHFLEDELDGFSVEFMNLIRRDALRRLPKEA